MGFYTSKRSYLELRKVFQCYLLSTVYLPAQYCPAFYNRSHRFRAPSRQIRTIRMGHRDEIFGSPNRLVPSGQNPAVGIRHFLRMSVLFQPHNILLNNDLYYIINIRCTAINSQWDGSLFISAFRLHI